MARRRLLIATGIVLILIAVGALTAIALLVDVAVALWGMFAFFGVLLVARIFGPDTTWLKARSKLFDSLFLAAIMVGLWLTISFATTPSPI